MQRFEQGEAHLSDYELRYMFKHYHKTDELLKECNVNGLCVAIFDLGQAYRRFFEYHKERPDVKFIQKKIEHYIRISKTMSVDIQNSKPRRIVNNYIVKYRL